MPSTDVEGFLLSCNRTIFFFKGSEGSLVDVSKGSYSMSLIIILFGKSIKNS